MKSVGVDIGGMSVKIGLVENGKILQKRVIKTEKNCELFVKYLTEEINLLLSENNLKIQDISGIGIGCPGSISVKTGVIEFAGNLDWTRFALVDEMSKTLKTKYRLVNDANAATFGEVKYGVAKGYSNVIMFTLGTGVGGGIIIDNKLYEGNEDKAGEVGHTLLVLNGEQCTCGRKGCIEAYVSASALIRDTKREMLKNPQSKMWEYAENDIEKVNGRTAFECEKIGDESAKKVVDDYIMYLSEAMMDYFNIFRPEAFVLGGGVSGEGKNLTDRIDKYCAKWAYGFKGTPNVKILTATFGNDAGIIGAAALLEE